MPSIPGFGRLVWGRKASCFSCGKTTRFAYLNPNGEKNPCCKECFDRIHTFVRTERRKNTLKRYAFYIVWGLGLVVMLIAIYLLVIR